MAGGVETTGDASEEEHRAEAVLGEGEVVDEPISESVSTSVRGESVMAVDGSVSGEGLARG